MKRKIGKKNIKLFILFSFLVVIIIVLFVYIIFNVMSFDKTMFEINADSFMYDIDNNYVLLKKSAELSQKWDKHYYLKYDDKNIDMGMDVVVFNSNESLIYVYGNNYKIDLNGNVSYNTKKTEISKLGNPTFYKLDDRKYLMVAGKIKTKNDEINTNSYVIIEIDKQGNALLLNNEINLKTLSTLILETSSYNFDIANEKLIVGDVEIDLKKVSGSTNQYVEPEEENKNSNNNSNAGNGGSSNGSYGGGYAGGYAGGNMSVVDTDQKLNIVKSAHLTSLSVATSYIDVYYSVIDPKNEYTSVYLDVSSGEYEQKIVLNKSNNLYRIMNLTPNTKYSIKFGYTHFKDGNSNTVEDEVVNNVYAKTSINSSSISVVKVNKNQIFFNVKYDSTYAFESANVAIYNGNSLLGVVPIDTEKALSSEGFSASFTDNGFLLAGVFELRLENCVFNGVDVSSTVNIKTKYVNSY